MELDQNHICFSTWIKMQCLIRLIVFIVYSEWKWTLLWPTEVIVQSVSTPFLWKLPYLNGEFLTNAKVNKKVKSKGWTLNQGQEERKEEQDTLWCLQRRHSSNQMSTIEISKVIGDRSYLGRSHRYCFFWYCRKLVSLGIWRQFLLPPGTTWSVIFALGKIFWMCSASYLPTPQVASKSSSNYG